MQDMERDLELNQNFFLDNNVDHKQKVIPKKRRLKRVVTRFTALQKFSRNIF